MVVFVKNLKINSLWFFLLTYFYLEIVFKLITHNSLFSLSTFNITLFIVFLALFCKFLTSLFKPKINNTVFYLILFFIALFYSVQVVVHNIFGFYFDFSLLGATDQILSFSGDMFT